MAEKYVKDRAHNRYKAYCCDDIDARVGALEEALAALVAGTVPDGAVTLAKLAEDARTYTREINKGRLISEWIGTQEEYEAHLAEIGGSPLPNVRYSVDSLAWKTITAPDFAHVPVQIDLQEGAVYIIEIGQRLYNNLKIAVIMAVSNYDSGFVAASHSACFKLPYVKTDGTVDIHIETAYLMLDKDKKMHLIAEGGMNADDAMRADYTVRYAKIT